MYGELYGFRKMAVVGFPLSTMFWPAMGIWLSLQCQAWIANYGVSLKAIGKGQEGPTESHIGWPS